MTRRDNMTRWRAKGLWIGVFMEPDAGLHTEGGNRVMGQDELWPRISVCRNGRTRRSRQESRFEAVLGKTRRTEF